jgi:hypothetical protein
MFRELDWKRDSEFLITSGEGKPMMKISMGILLCAAMLATTGCFDMPSVYPLYTDETAMAEPRLVGAWQSKDGKDQIYVKSPGDRQYRLSYINDDGGASLWELRVVKLGETSVADMMPLKDDQSIPPHHFMALSFKDQVMRVWFLDSGVLRVKAGKENLAYVHGAKNDTVLTAPTASIVSFLKKNLAEELKREADQEWIPLR